MLTIYPRAIPAFPTHRNLLDDVDASHVNNIQNELTSIAGALGVNPALYNDVSLTQVVTTGTTGDTGSIDDSATSTVNGAPRAYDANAKIVDHVTVSARLDYIQKGQQNHCFVLQASGLDIGSSDTGLSADLKAVRFPKPNANRDPFGLFSGAGVNLLKSGFYTFHGAVIYNLLGPTDASNTGAYVSGIAVDGAWVDGSEKVQVSGSSAPVHVNTTLSGFFNAGTNIRLRVAQNSGRQQRIRSARLTGFMIRETVGG